MFLSAHSVLSQSQTSSPHLVWINDDNHEMARVHGRSEFGKDSITSFHPYCLLLIWRCEKYSSRCQQKPHEAAEGQPPSHVHPVGTKVRYHLLN